jgi:hypothetical protein
MISKRLLALITTAAAVGIALPADASPASIHPETVKLSHGLASVVISNGIGADVTDVVTGDGRMTYDITLTGSFAVHDWTYSGRLRGESQSATFNASLGEIEPFTLDSDDGTVHGDCGGSRTEDEVTAVNPTATNAGDFTFDCVFTRNGGTPWQIVLRAQTVLSGASTSNLIVTESYTGVFDASEVDSAFTDDGTQQTYGDVQFAESWDRYDGDRCGPLRLSGRLQIGSVAYTGDLVSEVTDFFFAASCPPLTITGSSNGVDVTGTCQPVPEARDVVESNTGLFTREVWDISCHLATNGGEQVAVPLRATFTSMANRGNGWTYGWSDLSGYYTAA